MVAAESLADLVRSLPSGIRLERGAEARGRRQSLERVLADEQTRVANGAASRTVSVRLPSLAVTRPAHAGYALAVLLISQMQALSNDLFGSYRSPRSTQRYAMAGERGRASCAERIAAATDRPPDSVDQRGSDTPGGVTTPPRHFRTIPAVYNHISGRRW